jgi:hypothetical protein
MTEGICDVCFTPESRHDSDIAAMHLTAERTIAGCPTSAITGRCVLWESLAEEHLYRHRSI